MWWDCCRGSSCGKQAAGWSATSCLHALGSWLLPLTPTSHLPPLSGYTHERYREIIHSIRRYMPDASVSGDAIVGFPGETEEQFQRTVALVEEVGFDRVNTGE